MSTSEKPQIQYLRNIKTLSDKPTIRKRALVPGADFSMTYLEGLDLLVDLDLHESDFSGSLLRYCAFLRCDLSCANFARCTIKDCHFEECNLYSASFGHTLLGNRFTRCSMQEAWFRGCFMSSCVFRGCNLSKATLKEASLTDTDFREECNLNGVSLVYSDAHESNIPLNGTMKLNGATGLRDPHVAQIGTRDDGYSFLMTYFDEELRILAGCQDLPWESAKGYCSIPTTPGCRKCV